MRSKIVIIIIAVASLFIAVLTSKCAYSDTFDSLSHADSMPGIKAAPTYSDVNLSRLKIPIKGGFYSKKKTKYTLSKIASIVSRSNVIMYGVDRANPTSTILNMAYTMWAEGRGAGSVGMMYIGSVIVNRMASHKYPNSAMGVIHQKGAFSCWGESGGYQRILVNTDYVYFLQAINLAVGLYIKDLTPITTSVRFNNKTYVELMSVNNFVKPSDNGFRYYIDPKVLKIRL